MLQEVPLEIFVLTLGLMLLSIGGLAAGVLAGRPPIKGSCGGLSCIDGAECGVCRKQSRKGDET